MFGHFPTLCMKGFSLMSLFIVDFKKILPSKYCFCLWCLDLKSNEHEVRNIKYLNVHHWQCIHMSRCSQSVLLMVWYVFRKLYVVVYIYLCSGIELSDSELRITNRFLYLSNQQKNKSYIARAQNYLHVLVKLVFWN